MYTAHTIASAYGSKLLLHTAHAVANRVNCVKSRKIVFTIFISALKSPTYRDFMIKKKSLEFKRSKSHTWAPLRKVEIEARI